MLVSNNH